MQSVNAIGNLPIVLRHSNESAYSTGTATKLNSPVQTLSKNTETTLELYAKDAVSVFEEVLEKVKNRTGKAEMPTGISELDKNTFGLHRKELMVIAARTSHGKTAFSSQIVLNLIKENIPCLYISLEMADTEILERIICNNFRIHAWDLRQGIKSTVEDFIAKAPMIKTILLATPLILTNRSGRTIQEVEALATRFKPACIVVDHAQMCASHQYKSKHEAVSAYVQGLKSIALNHDCAVILNSQVNRQGSGADNQLDFMKYSGELEECADIVIQAKWLYRSDDSKNIGDYEISIVKQRNGPTLKINLEFEPQYYSFGARANDDE